MNILATLQIYFCFLAIILAIFIFCKYKRTKNHVFNYYLHYVSLLALLTREISIILLAIFPKSHVTAIPSGLCFMVQGWLTVGTLALINKRTSEQEQNQERNPMREDFNLVKSYLKEKNAKNILFLIWNFFMSLFFFLSVTDSRKEISLYKDLLVFTFYFTSAAFLRKTNRTNLLPETSKRIDVLVIGFIVLGFLNIIISLKPAFLIKFILLIIAVYFILEAVIIHNFSRLFNYNGRISFQEFDKQKDTATLDSSHVEDQGKPSEIEINNTEEKESKKDENENENESEAA